MRSVIDFVSSAKGLPVVAALSMAVLTGCSGTTSSVSGYGLLTDNLQPNSYVNQGSRGHGSLQARIAAQQARNAPGQMDYASIYAARYDGDVLLPAVDYTRFNKKHLRQQVRYFGPERPGSIVIDASQRLLYLVQPGGTAMRYGIAVGKEGFGWTGGSTLQWKQKWPTWTPPAEMIERSPELAEFADGMKGSIKNPLGARAMYLFKDGRDTMYRIHGTNKPYSIGKAASSGCFRMINQDVIDLYSRVGSKVYVSVRPQLDPTAASSI